jgi:hypothetical protein
MALTSCADEAFSEAQEAVRRDLRDPESAQFRDVKRCDKPNAIQGEVNAKNAYGGYTGFKPFIYVDGRSAILGENLESWELAAWEELTRLCWSDEILKKVEAETNILEPDDLEANAL